MQSDSPEPDDTAVTVFSSRYQGVCHERGLVLRALGIAYRVRNGERGWRVEVSSLDAIRAREEIEAYNREQAAPVSVPAPIEQRSDGVTGVVVFCMVMLFFFVLDKRGIFGIDWLAAGRLDAGDMRAGQWWRAVTALTLHLDAAHLAANLSFGAFFGLFVGQYLGQGAGWLAILLSGAAGNIVNALVQAENHRAVGASTAVFAALGLLAAYIFRRGFKDLHPWPRRWAPLVGAVVLLVWTGTGDENTDIFAHLSGFVCGMAIGLVLAAPRWKQWLDRTHSQAPALAVFAIIWVSWLVAL